MDVLTSETCWASNNEINKASDIKLVFLYSTIKMMHGPINVRWFDKHVNPVLMRQSLGFDIGYYAILATDVKIQRSMWGRFLYWSDPVFITSVFYNASSHKKANCRFILKLIYHCYPSLDYALGCSFALGIPLLISDKISGSQSGVAEDSTLPLYYVVSAC